VPVNADANPSICGNIKAARLTFADDPSPAVIGARNLRARPVTGRSKAPKVGDVRQRKRVDSGIAATPVSAAFRPTGEFSAAARRATTRPRLSATQCASLCAPAPTSLRSSAEYDAPFARF
jgi:hypothetical protein